MIAMGEFGRTPHINPAMGRDYWPNCWSLVLGGGGIRGGKVIGASDERGAKVAERLITIGDLFATVYKAFGIDWTKTYMTPNCATSKDTRYLQRTRPWRPDPRPDPNQQPESTTARRPFIDTSSTRSFQILNNAARITGNVLKGTLVPGFKSSGKWAAAMKTVPTLLLFFIASMLTLSQSQKNEEEKAHPPDPGSGRRAELDEVTSQVTAGLAGPVESLPVQRNNYIDDFIFDKLQKDQIPYASLSSDAAFLRRAHLDLTGRLPEVSRVRSFLKDTDPGKRSRLVDELTDAKVDPDAQEHPSFPFLDRWTYFLCDLFRITQGEIGSKGRNLFWDYINTALLLDVPYDQLVTEMLTAKARSNWESAAANYLVRYHADDADGLGINHEDSIEDITISSTKNFLGVNLECIACHDGAHHLEKINLWLSGKKREEFWRQASFFGGMRMFRGFGIGQEFPVQEAAHRYDLTYPSVKRMQRYPAETTPTFLLTGERAKPAEGLRRAYARMVTSHPQFARTTVNLIWTELMGVGIVDPPFEFDLARQDPKNPPPQPWSLQPTHPELLDAMAKDFVKNNHSLRFIIRRIAKSSAYQLSSRFSGEWSPSYAKYFARRNARRLSAAQLHDGISQATQVFPEIPIMGTNLKVKYVMQTRGPYDLEGELKVFLASFGRSNRDVADKSLASSTVQASLLLNSELIKEKVRADQGRLKALLKQEPLRSNEAIVEELFLATLGRFPGEKEKQLGVTQIERYRESGAEDLLWSLLNTKEFLFNL